MHPQSSRSHLQRTGGPRRRGTDIPAVFLLRKAGLTGTAAAPFFALATYLLCLGLALLCFKYFEDPARRYLGNLGSSRKERSLAN